MKKILSYSFLLICLISAVDTFGQKRNKQQTFEEEIIRYLGYEEVPVRYLSLPYDSTMSHNVEGNFMDIGFILLMFIPLLFLWRTRGKIWRGILFALLVLMTILSIGSSHILSKSGIKLFADEDVIGTYLQNGGDGVLSSLVGHVYSFFGKVYAPIGSFLESVTANGDHITYVILIGIIYLLYFVYSKYSRRKGGEYLLGALLLFYCFFMLVLSAGIIWYGFLMFPLLYLEIAKYARDSTTYKYCLYAAGGIFVLLAYVLKISNTTVRNDVAMGPVQPPVLAYNFSNATGNEVYEGYFRNIGPAIDQINAEDTSLIFQAGTFLTFLIKNNNNRVFKDGILNIHSQMVDKFKRKSTLNRALKESGYRYIIVSPVLHLMDQTPNKSLTAKFQKMAAFLHQNPGLKLLATDRLVRTADSEGNLSNEYKFSFGQDVEVLQNGSYAIFEIL